MKQVFIIGILLSSGFCLSAQQRLGINTQTPFRTLDVLGFPSQYIRVHSTTGIGGATGLELVRGTNLSARDWKIVNDNGYLKFFQNDDNFATNGTEVMRFDVYGNMGIGTNIPTSTLHIDGGTQLSSGHGYLTLGTQALLRLAFDNHSLQARDNNASTTLFIQSYGGDTHFGSTGGRTFMAQGGGQVSIGSNNLATALNVEDSGFQMYLRNDADDVNDWYIGSSNHEWNAGNQQLLFSPSSNSDDAVLRLRNVTENDGNIAPVMIHSSESQTILLDGNEIDTRGAPLYINHNSDQNTYLNAAGGRVGIGTSSPQATVHVNVSSGTNLTLQKDNVEWHINAQTVGNGDLSFTHENLWMASVDGASGQWTTASDARLKENIMPLQNVIDKVKKVNVYNYTFKHDDHRTQQIGVLAQELQEEFPEVVKQHQDGQYGVAYAHLSVIALKAIQEQQQHIATLRDKLAKLKAQHGATTATPQVPSASQSH